MRSGQSVRADVHEIDPLKDPRWTAFVHGNPQSSIFHSRGWLEALRRTYGYTPMAFTTSHGRDDLKNALVFASVPSWLTGRRIVSLPFSDHCQPLFDASEDLECVLNYLQTESRRRWRYVEIRPLTGMMREFQPGASYRLHRVDLRPDLNDIFRGLDKDSVQRRIRRAERAGLTEKCGRSAHLLNDFYKLLILTRRRHGVPPQPLIWFQNLLDALGEAAEIKIAYASEGLPVAAIFTLRFRDTLVYKYGCSDTRFNHTGAMSLLLWRAIQDAKASGAREFDLGRTDEDNPGLVAFKNHWTSHSERLTYWRFPSAGLTQKSRQGWTKRLAGLLLARMPDRVLTTAGKLAYRHIG